MPGFGYPSPIIGTIGVNILLHKRNCNTPTHILQVGT